MEDTQILDLYWAKNDLAISETHKSYGPKLFSLSQRILENTQDAEENVNDTYLRTWDAIPPQRPRHFCAFLCKICRHLALDRLDWNRAAKRNAEVVSLTEEMSQCIPDSLENEAMDAHQLRRTLESFLSTLPSQTRLIFLRRYLYVDTVAEIAKRYGISESKVKMQLHRTREKLRTYLAREGITV